ncbi:hypothetical protein C7974DRAFT_429206 [Boeremia exigua]|uniref:uncharacterized protein n=1 Tax=Boeremia exigua TaxID=749465 RepID=UPI001E8E7013|nr:uncharacterized protein C7974DRAFT_429206 [Boeremia exigua]KAH6612731.1 hypothetical protein C7974DRAFT_429206 [Boeremia exigua]
MAYRQGAKTPESSFSPQARTFSGLLPSQQPKSSLSEQTRALGLSVNGTPTRTNHATRSAGNGAIHATGRSSLNSDSRARNIHQGPQAFSLAGVPEAVAVQETAFRQGQRDRSRAINDTPTNPFARKFDQLWTSFHKLGKECSDQHIPTPVDVSQHNFDWTVLINPYTQSLQNPRGFLDLAWSYRMIQATLNCMEELIRVICQRHNGWDKIVADIPQPAQEALVAFPDLAQLYERLSRDAKEARAGGRPYGY